MMGGAKKRVPKRRFKDFLNAGEWKERKLSELATMNARIGWQNLRTSEFLDSGDYLLITGTDFDNGRVKYSTCHYVEKKRFDQDTKIQLSTGSILITKDGTLGKVALVEELPKPATLNAGVFNVRVKDDTVLSYKYLYHYLKAPFLMKYVTANATGGTIKHLNQSILVDFPIPITEKPEQDRITKLLDSLESSITLHQRKLDKLQATKKALLQEMFPEEGQNKPKRRFKGFTDAWEQRKLGDIVDFLDDQRKPLKESDRIKGKYPYYGASGIIDYINDYLFDENLVLLSEDGANIIDRNYPVCFIATGKYWVNNHAHVLKVKAGIIDKFICESLERLDYTKFNTGTAQPKLNQDICQKIMITIPNEDEQKCISEFLDRINNIITLHQRKLDKLKNLKQAYLNEMFV